jgi:site-specific DNA recombinase
MKAVLYARVSSDKQDIDLSISAQLKALREYAARNGYQVVREFVDEARSGRSADREEFGKMIALAKSKLKPFDKIFVYKLSRFARDRETSILYKSLLKKRGVQVISITEPVDDTAMGRWMEGMIECCDEFYSANLGEEILRGLNESTSRGFFVGGIAPYGYTISKVPDGGKLRSKLSPDDYKASVVVRIFDSLLDYKGIKEIIKMLTEEGIKSPGGNGWTKTTLYHILTNEAYTGTLVWGKRSNNPKITVIKVQDAWPAIIDRQTFNRVQEILRERAPAKRHPRSVSSQYLLSGLIRCGHCGKAIIGQEAKSGKYAYYVCGTLLKKGAGTCTCSYLNTSKFENIIIQKINDVILDRENLKELVRLTNAELANQTDIFSDNLKSIDYEIIGVQRRLDNLYEALETKKLDLCDLAPRIKELRQHQEMLQLSKQNIENILANKRVDLIDLKLMIEYASDLRQLLAESTIEEQKALIRGFIKEIIVTRNKVEIKYTMPVPSNKTGSAEVLDIERTGSAYRIRTGDLLLEREVS